MERRAFITTTLAASAAAAATGIAVTTASSADATGVTRPHALVYRGPASCDGCAESVAALLRTSPAKFTTEYCGPHETTQLTAANLARATLYAQPGGGDLDPGWAAMRPYAGAIRDYVRRGGRYLGFCLGGYLAGATPGFDLLPGDTDEYVGSPGADVHTTDDTIVTVRWRGKVRHMFFQDGPIFDINQGAKVTTLATYHTGAIAALVTRYGKGAVGVVGPHPEADASWYEDDGLHNPDGIRFDLGYDLVMTTLRGH